MIGGLLGLILSALVLVGPHLGLAPGGGCVLRATLVDEGGRAVTEARLGARSMTGGTSRPDAAWLVPADERGRVALLLPPDIYRWSVAAVRHPTTVERTVDLTASCAAADLGRVELADGLPVAGRVVDPERRPLAGTTVRLYWDPGTPRYLTVSDGFFVRPVREGETGADGRFRVPGLAPGTEVDLSFHRTGFAWVRRSALPGGEPLTVALEPAAVLAVEVVEDEGVPVAGAEVDLRHLGGGQSFGAVRVPKVTDEAGRYEEPSVPPGEVEITVRASGHRVARRTVVLAAGERARERFVLERLPSAPVVLRIVDDRGRPVEGAQASLASSPRVEGGVYLVARSDERGGVEWPRVALGAYEITVHAPQAAAAERPQPIHVELARGGVEREVVLARLAGLGVGGQVVGPEGVGIGGATVEVWAGGGRFEARTEGDGRFGFEHLPFGEHDVTLAVPGLAGLPRVKRRVGREPEPWLFEVPAGTAVTGLLRPAPGLDPARPWRLTASSAESGSAEGWLVGEGLAFRFPPLAPGAWTLSASDGDGARGSVAIELTGRPDEVRQDIDVPAPAAGFPVFGTLTHRGAPLAGARVALEPRSRDGRDHKALTAMTDAAGSFALADVPAGSYVLAVTERFPILRRTVTIAGPTDLGRELRFAWVRGRVEHPAGEPESITVRMQPHGPVDGTAGWSHVTHAYPEWLRPRTDGAFEAGPLEEGRWIFEVTAPGYVTVRREVTIAGEDVEDLVLELVPAAGLTVRVATASGRPPGSFSVTYRPETGTEIRDWIDEHAAAGGVARLDQVPPGRGMVVVKTEYVESAPVPVQVPGGPVAIDLPPRGKIQIRAPFLSDADAAAATLVIRRAGEKGEGRERARRSRFHGRSPARTGAFLPPGLYELSVELEGRTIWAHTVEVRDHQTVELVVEE